MLELIYEGWVPYGFAPFEEDLREVLRLVGSIDYEVRQLRGLCYIRRADRGDENAG